MDDVYVSEKLLRRLRIIEDIGNDLLSSDALDAIIDDRELDLSEFEAFVSHLDRTDRDVAEEFISALENRLKERSQRKDVSRKLGATGKSTRITGTVKWFNDAKGFGFVSSDDRSVEAFVHFSAIQGTGFSKLKPGQHVKFELTKSDDGQLFAQHLKLDE